MSLNVQADAGFLCEEAAVLGETITGALCIIR